MTRPDQAAITEERMKVIATLVETLDETRPGEPVEPLGDYAELAGCKLSALMTWMTRHAPEVLERHRQLKRAWLEARREEVARQHAAGASRDDIAEEFGVTTQTIRNDLIALGLLRPARRRAGAVEERRARVRELHEAGVDLEGIAREIGVSESTARNDLTALGFRQRGEKRQRRRKKVVDSDGRMN